MDSNQIFALLKAGQFREALDLLRLWWQELRWEIRLAVVATVVTLLLAWIFSTAGGVAALLVLPLGICALIAIARPTTVPAKVDGFVQRMNERRQRALAKGTFFGKWVARPFYASLSGSASLTAPIKDPYLRAGTTITVQSYAVYLALAIASIAIYAALILACLAFVLWIIAYALSDHSGSRTVSTVSRAVSWGMSGRSEEREDVFGRQYTQHYDDEYNQTGSTETRQDVFGRDYRQNISPEGDYTGHSEQREDIFGNPYTQRFNEQGDQVGHSEEREDVFGRKYVQHFDEEDNPVGRSEERENIFGQKYTKHDEE